MTINIKYLLQKGLSPYDQFLMQLVFQNTSEDMSEQLQIYMEMDNLTRLLALELLTEVKAKNKKESEFRRLRLSKKGKEVLRNSQIADYTENDEKLFEYIVELYNKAGNSVGNDVKVKQLLAWFRVEAGTTRKAIYLAIKSYVDDLVDSDDEKFIASVENYIWKAPSVFSTKWTLGDSKLYTKIQEQ